MTQLKPLDLWVVELPEGADVLEIKDGNILTYWGDLPTHDFLSGKELPEGEWVFHFTTQTATEQDWAGVVPGKFDQLLADAGEDSMWWPDFNNPGLQINDATESGHSLLTANGLPVEKNYAILTPKK